jgi:hypothetical protein
MPDANESRRLHRMALIDRRASPREPLHLPIEWEDGRRGWTRDISPDGLYVYLPPGLVPAPWYALQIGWGLARLQFRAMAQVLRVEHGAAVTGVALRPLRRRFHSLR